MSTLSTLVEAMDPESKRSQNWLKFPSIAKFGLPKRSPASEIEPPAPFEEGPTEPEAPAESLLLKGVNVFFLHGILIRGSTGARCNCVQVPNPPLTWENRLQKWLQRRCRHTVSGQTQPKLKFGLP
jgi:hypothetical protein